MNIQKSIIGIFLIYLLITIGCGKHTHKYMYDRNFSKDEFPRKIYIAEQVNPLDTQGIIAEKKQPFVEITKRDGDQKLGKLKAINEEEVVLIEGYYFDEKNFSAARRDVEVTIAKKDILLLKMW